MNVCIIKQNYVIDVVVFHEEIPSGWQYPVPHDSVVHDPAESVAIGDWYEANEGLFYRPIGAVPPDLPQALRP